MTTSELQLRRLDSGVSGQPSAVRPRSRSVVRRTLHRVPAPLDRRTGLYERYGKRPFDVVGASAIILLASPVLVAAWISLRVALGPTVVITQDRVGKDGHLFGMYKFRTMRWSRRRARASYDGPDRRHTHKDDNDPRHTTIGRIFRRASIDELPSSSTCCAATCPWWVRVRNWPR